MLPLPDLAQQYPELFEDFILPARIQVWRDEILGPMFELHPRPDAASPKSWAWIVAARSGAMQRLMKLRDDARSVHSWWRRNHPRDMAAAIATIDAGFEQVKAVMLGKKTIVDLSVIEARMFTWSLLHDEGANDFLNFVLPVVEPGAQDLAVYGLETGQARGAAFFEASDMLQRWHCEISHAAQLEMFYGGDIRDLVAISLDFSKVLGRFLGAATVLGYPEHPDTEERPVRLYRDLRSFMAGLCSGALLIGAPDENYRWMAACKGGIVTDDVAHGRAVKKILTRPYAGPQVLVAG